MADPFAHPPNEVTRFLEAKGVKASWDWRDFSFDEHATAFTVAKSAGYDVLGDIKGALEKAIRDREDFEVFRDRLKPILQAKGWWGRKEVVDPVTGETKLVQLGSTRRLRTIYWANTRSAYGAGLWEKAQRTKRVLPFLIYVISTAEHKRELHLTWVGTVLPVDHPWWDTHYPPSAWGCMCRVRQVSEIEAEDLGYDPDADPPDDATYAWTNKQTGEVVRVPLGVDPGWGRNPGKVRHENVGKLLVDKIEAMDEETRRIAIEDLRGGWLTRRIVGGEVPFDPASTDVANVARGKLVAPVAVAPDGVAAALNLPSRVVSVSIADAAALAKAVPGGLPADWPEQLQTALDAGAVTRGGTSVFGVAIAGRLLRLRADAEGRLSVEAP